MSLPTEPEKPKSDQKSKPPKGSLESYALGPRVLGFLVLAIIAGAFIYFVLLGGEAHN